MHCLSYIRDSSAHNIHLSLSILDLYELDCKFDCFVLLCVHGVGENDRNKWHLTYSLMLYKIIMVLV